MCFYFNTVQLNVKTTNMYKHDYLTLVSDLIVSIVISISILWDFCPFSFVMKCFFTHSSKHSASWGESCLQQRSDVFYISVLFVWNETEEDLQGGSVISVVEETKKKSCTNYRNLNFIKRKSQNTKYAHTVWLTGDLWKCRVAAVSAEQQRRRQKLNRNLVDFHLKHDF